MVSQAIESCGDTVCAVAAGTVTAVVDNVICLEMPARLDVGGEWFRDDPGISAADVRVLVDRAAAQP